MTSLSQLTGQQPLAYVPGGPVQGHYYPYDQGYHHPGYQIPVAPPMGGVNYCDWSNSGDQSQPVYPVPPTSSHVVQVKIITGL